MEETLRLERMRDPKRLRLKMAWGIDLFKSHDHNRSVKAGTVRTSIGIPRDLPRRIHEAAV